jgi:hypothetical protein
MPKYSPERPILKLRPPLYVRDHLVKKKKVFVFRHGLLFIFIVAPCSVKIHLLSHTKTNAKILSFII